MSASTSQPSEDTIKVEKGSEGELKKTISTAAPSSAETTTRKDDDKSTFRGPDSGSLKLFNVEDLKKLKVTLEIKNRKAAAPTSGAAIDPSSITPVRRPDPDTVTEKPNSVLAEDVGTLSEDLVNKAGGHNEPAFTADSEDGSSLEEILKGEGKVPLFSMLPSLNEGDEKTVKKEPASQKAKSDRDKPSSSLSRAKTRSRSGSRRRDYHVERDELIRRQKEAYFKERARRERRERRRPRRHRPRSRSRSSSESEGSSSDSRSRSRSRSKSRSSHKSDQRHRRSRSTGRRRSGSRSRSRSRSREHRRRHSSRERASRQDCGHHNQGHMPEMMHYPSMGGGAWGPRPPFIRHPMMPGPYPPMPIYHGPIMYAPPFRPAMMRGPPRHMLRRP